MARWNRCRKCGGLFTDPELVEMDVTMGKYNITIMACPDCREDGLMDAYNDEDVYEDPEPDYDYEDADD